VNDGKLEPMSKKCIFLGYEDGVKGYRLWCSDPRSPKFIISTYVYLMNLPCFTQVISAKIFIF
jgi:hypothetical protein